MVATEFLAATTRGVLSLGLASPLVALGPVPGRAGAAKGEGARSLAGVSRGRTESVLVDPSMTPAVVGPGEPRLQLARTKPSTTSRITPAPIRASEACLELCTVGKLGLSFVNTAGFQASFMVEPTQW